MSGPDVKAPNGRIFDLLARCEVLAEVQHADSEARDWLSLGESMAKQHDMVPLWDEARAQAKDRANRQIVGYVPVAGPSYEEIREVLARFLARSQQATTVNDASAANAFLHAGSMLAEHLDMYVVWSSLLAAPRRQP